MPAKLKYGEPTQMISMRVPQSRKEEIRELVRGVLNGDDGWHLLDVKMPTMAGFYVVEYIDGDVEALEYSTEDNQFYYEHAGRNYVSSQRLKRWCELPQPPKSK